MLAGRGGGGAAARPLARSLAPLGWLSTTRDKEAQQRARAIRSKPHPSQQHTYTGALGSLALRALSGPRRWLLGCGGRRGGGSKSVTVFTLRGARLFRALPPPRATARHRRGARRRRRARRGLSRPNDMMTTTRTRRATTAAAGDDGGRARAALRGRGGERARATPRPRLRRRAALAPRRTARVLLLLVLRKGRPPAPPSGAVSSAAAQEFGHITNSPSFVPNCCPPVFFALHRLCPLAVRGVRGVGERERVAVAVLFAL